MSWQQGLGEEGDMWHANWAGGVEYGTGKKV